MILMSKSLTPKPWANERPHGDDERMGGTTTPPISGHCPSKERGLL